MRKILRKMYRNAVPSRYREKTSVEKNGVIVPGTWCKWLKNGGPKKYVEAIERRTAKA